MTKECAEAYDAGWDAYKNGKTVSDNPFNGIVEKELWEAWKNGFYAAAWDD